MTTREAEFAVSLGAPAAAVATVGVGIYPDEVTGGNGDGFRNAHQLDGFVVGSLGALAPDKGSIDLVRGVTLARESGAPVRLVAAGPELGGFSAWWRSQPSAMRQGVKLLGVISEPEKRDLLAGIDALALPSRTESFGIVYLEAWANLRPVVAAEAGAVPELVHDGVNGLLVPFGAPGRIAEAFRLLQQNPALGARMGEAGNRLLHAKYTWPLVLQRMYDAYDRVLGIAL
jgi:glycosyltransferase involved in cell wall biosynthesis